MTNSVNKPKTAAFPRVDSASEIHGNASLTKPFARRSKLSDLVGEKSPPNTPRSVKEFPLASPKASRKGPAADVRETLEDIGEGTIEALEGLQGATEDGLRTMRHVITAAPETSWHVTAGEKNANIELAGQRLLVQCGSTDTVTMNRGGGAATLAFDSDAHTKLALTQDVKSTGLGIAQTVDTTKTSSDVLRADIFGAEHLRGMALSNTWTTTGGTRVGGSLAAVVVGGSKLEALEWDDHEQDASGRILAKWETQLMPIVAVDMGASWMHLGGSVRASAYKSYQNIFQVYVAPDELSKAMLQRHGLAHAVASGFQTLGMRKAPVALPALKKVLAERQANYLQVGESVRMVRTGNMSGGLAMSAYGVRAGLYGSYTGETELTVARVDEHHLDVTISPKKITSLSANFDALIAAEMFTTSSMAVGLSRGFRADLREEPTRDALRVLFDEGVYPGCDNLPARLGAHASVDMTQQVRHGHLPKGMSTTFMQRAEQVDMSWGLGMPKPFFLTGRIAGLGLEGKVFERQQTTADGAASLTVKTLGRNSQRDVWGAGSTYKQLSVGVRQLELFDEVGRPEKHFDGLDVKLVKGLTRVVGDARARLTHKVGKLLGTEIAEPKQKGDAQTYAVSVERLFTKAKLMRIAKSSRVDRLRTAFQAGVPMLALNTLSERIASLKDNRAPDSLELALGIATEVQAFMVTHGQRGFAAMHYMSEGSTEDIDVSVDSSAFDKPVKKALKVQLEYGTTRDARSLKRGVREAARVEEETKRGVSHLQDENILKTFNSEDHNAKLTALQAVQSEVEKFVGRLKERLTDLSEANFSTAAQGA